MTDFQFSDYKFSEADVKKLLTSPEGKQLLQMLSRDGGSRLKQAADALKSGNTARFQEILSPVVSSDEVQSALKKLDRK